MKIVNSLSGILPGTSTINPEDGILLSSVLAFRAIDVILDEEVED